MYRCYVPGRISIVIYSFLVQMCGRGCVPCVLLGLSLSLSPSHSVPSQAESPSPVARYQSMPVTESGVYKGSPVFAVRRHTSPLLQIDHFGGLLFVLRFCELCLEIIPNPVFALLELSSRYIVLFSLLV